MKNLHYLIRFYVFLLEIKLLISDIESVCYRPSAYKNPLKVVSIFGIYFKGDSLLSIIQKD